MGQVALPAHTFATLSQAAQAAESHEWERGQQFPERLREILAVLRGVPAPQGDAPPGEHDEPLYDEQAEADSFEEFRQVLVREAQVWQLDRDVVLAFSAMLVEPHKRLWAKLRDSGRQANAWASRADALLRASAASLRQEGDAPQQELCDRCDGCGWYEGGPALKTRCEKCNGTGVRGGASSSGSSPLRERPLSPADLPLTFGMPKEPGDDMGGQST